MPVRRHQKRIQAVCHRRATCRFDEGSRGHEHSSARDPPCHAWWLGTGISIYSNRLPGLYPPRSPGWKKPCKREPTSITTNTHGTGRPTGSKRFHSDFTPMFQLWYDRRAVNGTNRSGRPGTHATQPLVVLGAIYVPYLAASLFITISSTSLAAIPSNASSTCPKGLATPTSVFPGTNTSTPSIPALFHQSG